MGFVTTLVLLAGAAFLLILVTGRIKTGKW